MRKSVNFKRKTMKEETKTSEKKININDQTISKSKSVLSTSRKANKRCELIEDFDAEKVSPRGHSYQLNDSDKLSLFKQNIKDSVEGHRLTFDYSPSDR